MYYEDNADNDWVEDDSDEEDDLLACPSCRQLVHEDTQQCPHCGDWITPVYPQRRSRRFLWITAAILLIAALIWMTVR